MDLSDVTHNGPGKFFSFSLDPPVARVRHNLGAIAGALFAACHRFESFWMKPWVGSDARKIPVETQALFVELSPEAIALLVPLIDGAMRCSLEGSEEGLILVAESGTPAVTADRVTGLSGGPIYVSDKPGQHDVTLLRQLVCSDGTILRADQPATLTCDCLFQDPTQDATLLKIWNTTRHGACGILGFFNCGYGKNTPILPEPVTAMARASDVPLLPATAQYCLYSHRTAACKIITHEEPIPIALLQGEWEILTIIPLKSAPQGAFAIIGLIEKLNGSAAVLTETYSQTLTLRDSGMLGLWCDPLPQRIELNGNSIRFQAQNRLLTVHIPINASVTPITLHWS